MVVLLIDKETPVYPCSPAEVFRAGHIRRYFIYVPMEATWASVSLKASHSDKCQRFTLHAVQLKPKSSVKTLEYYKVSGGRAGQGEAIRAVGA